MTGTASLEQLRKLAHEAGMETHPALTSWRSLAEFGAESRYPGGHLSYAVLTEHEHGSGLQLWIVRHRAEADPAVIPEREAEIVINNPTLAEAQAALAAAGWTSPDRVV